VIIFKEGKSKTIEYGLLKGIPVVNPLWLHDSLTQNLLLPKDSYTIKKTFTEVLNEKVLSSNNSSSTNSMVNKALKKRNSEDPKDDGKKQKAKKSEGEKKFIDLNNFKEEINRNKTITEKVKSAINSKPKSETGKDKDKENKKITNFFGKSEKKPRLSSSEDYNDKLHICSYCLDEGQKSTIKSLTQKLGIFTLNKIPITSIDKLKEHSYIVTTENYRKHDLKIIYAILNNIRLLNFTYFEQASIDNSYPTDIELYLIPFPIDILKLREIKPLAVDKFKISLHENLGGTKPLLLEIVKLLGDASQISEHLRLSDICIVNKYEVDTIPSNVKLLNQDFLIDSFLNMKLMDLDNMKYFPEKLKKKKL
jgi:hypothetical protein